MSKSILFAFFLCCSLPSLAQAQVQKFVYAFDHQGQLLLPKNAATQCPDPNGDNTAATVCHGVLVEDDGNYSLRMASKNISLNKLILVANEYELISGGSSGNGDDVYVLLQSQRRVDQIDKDQTNNGVNINKVSEAAVKAVEKAKHVPKSKIGGIITELAEVIESIDADALNQALGNGKQDNTPSDESLQRVNDYITAQQEQLDESQEELLVSLAEAAIENQDNDNAIEYIRKNVLQGLVEPALLSEVATRVFSHISDLQINDPDASIMRLEADKYLLFLNETSQLTTANSINADNFFAYTWQGVQSETSSAVFSKPEKGSYLVCVTGEINNANDSSSDCVRLAVKNQVNAVARANRLRVGTGNTLRLSATLSIGAESYNWSGSGVFTDASAEVTTWSAPQTPGTYELTLSINDNEDADSLTITVFDVLPVAVAQADPYVVYLSDGAATTTLASGSIATDGSSVDFIEWSVPNHPNGAQASIADTSAAITQFNADLPGDYTLQLLASKRGRTDITEITIQVRDPGKPKAIVGEDIVTYRNQAVLLDGSRSYAPINKPLSYFWSSDSGSLSAPSQAISYFTVDSLGEFAATLTVDDGDLSDTDSLKISVRNRLPAASDDVVANLLNEILHDQLLAVDDDGDAITYSLVTEPTSGGVTVDPLTGAYTYVPGGIKGCKYQPYSSPQDNGQGGLDVPVIKLCADKYVVAPGEVVNLTTSNSINASKFSGYEWLGGAVGDANDIREATYVGTTEGLYQVCVVGNIGQSSNTSTACVDIIVNANLVAIDDNVESGYIDSFQYQVNDGSGNSNIATVIITIGWENTPAVAEELSFTTPEDVSFNGLLQASDIDNHDISFRIISNGSLGTLTINDSNTGAFTYSPNANANGVDTISYVANDGFEDSDPANVIITIDQENDIPVAHFAGVLQTLEDVSVSGVLGATDPDDDVLDFRLATIPSKGDVVITDVQNGSFIYTPHADKNGSDSFFFVVHDGTVESNTAIVNIDIEPQNDQPIANDLGPLSAHADELITNVVSATDVDRDALVYQLQTTPNKGAVDLDPTTGQFVYTPNGSDLGSDSFTFVAKDAEVNSEPATVSFNILPPNLAPSVEDQTITVFAGVMYGGQLNASDPENSALSFSLVDNGRLGNAVISGSSGEFVYTANAFASGVDYFTVKVNDGDKDSETATILLNILSTAEVCQGPGSDKRDIDDDGYADLVELEFATSMNDANSTPFGLDPQAYGVSFIDDDDNDGYADIVELWLGSDYKDNASMPSDSTLKGIPDCLTPLFDTAPPALFAFNILTPNVDVSSGSAKARFALTAIDNAVGINEITVDLVSPSGSKVTATHTDTKNPAVSYVEFDSETFSRYSENGTWTVETLSISDVRGNKTSFPTSDLSARNYPTSLTVINGIAELPPVLESFQILTPSVEICGANEVASIQIVSSDDLTGIARVAVTLQSPSGDVFNWGEIIRNDTPTSLTATINSSAFRVFSETGSWQVSELSISDAAGNILALDTAALQLLGYSTAVEVSCSTPPANGATVLDSFDIPTNNVDVRSADPRARFDIDVADLAGVSEISIVLEGPSGQRMTVPYQVLGSPVSTVVSFYTDPFPLYAEPGPCVVYSLTVVDGAGIATTWYTQDLAGWGFTTSFNLINIGGTGYPNNAPFAYSGSFQTDEDVVYQGALSAIDLDGDLLRYSVVNQGNLGTVTITDANTGAFIYTPKSNVNYELNGEDSFTFKANDGYVDSNIASIRVTINAVDDATLVEDQTIEVEQDSTYTDVIVATDVDQLPLTYKIIDSGQLGSAYFLGNGTFQYVPNAGVTGDDQFTFQVNDANSTSRVGTVTVKILSNLPQLTDFNVLTPRVSGFDQLVYIAANFSLSRNINEFSESLLSLEGPSGQVVGLRSYVPENQYPVKIYTNVYTPSQALEPGLWTFKNLLIKREGSQFSELVVADIEAAGFSANVEVVANTSPTALTTDSYSVYLNSTLQETLNASDPENDTLSYRIVSNGNKGVATLVDASTGAFSYTPTALGTDTFTYIANDGLGDSNTGVVTIEILVPPQCHIVAQDITVNVAQDSAYIGTLPAVDPHGVALNFNIIDAPSLGTITVADDQSGEFVYRPHPDSIGEDSFTYQASNGSCDSAVATITVRRSTPPQPQPPFSITVFQNVTYSGSLTATDAENDTLTYQLVSGGSLGSVNINPVTGNFTYTPVKYVVGIDQFVFNVSDGFHTSENTVMTVNIISPQQACGAGGVVNVIDTDNDGYIDFLETALGTDPANNLSTPANINPADLGAMFNDDDDNDGHEDYVELWLNADPIDSDSVPEFVLADCFDPVSDGIKPRLIGFNVITPSMDISNSDRVVRFSLSLLDNASGIKRARVSLISPSGVFVTTSASFEDYPLLAGVTISSEPLTEFAEAGQWLISGITLFDEAGNRLDVTNEDLFDAGYATTIEVINTNADITAPVLDNFIVLTPDILYPGTTNQRMSVALTLTDDSSGISSARVDFISLSGTMVSASSTLSDNPLSETIQLETDVLSQYLEDGIWIVHSILVTDAAGNSAQLVDQLAANGLVTTINVTNPLSDITAPTLESFSVLSTDVYPLNGDTRMSFALTAYDDAAGIEKVRIDIVGPSGQILTAWGYFSAPYPVNADAQIDTAILGTMTEQGLWQVTAVEIFDDVGNSTVVEQSVLQAFGYQVYVQVNY